MNDVYINGPLHPDLFDGETPIRKKVPIKDVDLKVYRVNLTIHEPEQYTVYVVASDEAEAEDAAWDESPILSEVEADFAEVEEINLNTPLDRAYLYKKYWKGDGTFMTASDLLTKYIEEKNVCGC